MMPLERIGERNRDKRGFIGKRIVSNFRFIYCDLPCEALYSLNCDVRSESMALLRNATKISMN